MTFDENKYKIRSMQRLHELAIECLRPEKIYEWMNHENECLGGKRPFELCFTDEGYDQVEDLLQRIRWGIPE